MIDMEKQQAQAETSTTTATTGTSSSSNGDSSDAAPSALRDNIARKGKNAYYFAHAHKANGPEWDGKVEPKLLSKTSDLSLSENGGMKKNHSTMYQWGLDKQIIYIFSVKLILKIILFNTWLLYWKKAKREKNLDSKL